MATARFTALQVMDLLHVAYLRGFYLHASLKVSIDIQESAPIKLNTAGQGLKVKIYWITGSVSECGITIISS